MAFSSSETAHGVGRSQDSSRFSCWALCACEPFAQALTHHFRQRATPLMRGIASDPAFVSSFFHLVVFTKRKADCCCSRPFFPLRICRISRLRSLFVLHRVLLLQRKKTSRTFCPRSFVRSVIANIRWRFLLLHNVHLITFLLTSISGSCARAHHRPARRYPRDHLESSVADSRQK